MAHELRHAADAGADRREVSLRALGDGVREGLRPGGQGVDVDRAVKGWHIVHPSGEAGDVRDAERRCEGRERLPLLSVSGDEQAQLGVLRISEGEAAQQRRDVLHRVQPRRDADDNAVRRGAEPDPLEKRGARRLAPAGRGVELQPVIDRKNAVRAEAAGDELFAHRVRHADIIVHAVQREGVQRSVDRAGERAAQIVDFRVAVDGGEHRHAAERL